jgi:hypothetical protein
MEQSHCDSKECIVSWRPKHHVARIKNFREGKKSIVCTEEFWVSAGHTVQKEWRERTDETQGKLLWREYATVREPRFAMVHEQGFASNAKLCRKNIAGVHDEIDGNCYETYLNENFLDNLSLEMVIL